VQGLSDEAVLKAAEKKAKDTAQSHDTPQKVIDKAGKDVKYLRKSIALLELLDRHDVC
jgi:hypothetical protein